MIKLSATAVLVSVLVLTATSVRADDYYNYPEPCTFQAHTTVGTVSGTCATLQVPLAGYHSRWTLTLQFDAASMALASQLKPDQFADMVRTQSVENGTDIIVLGLWGDLEVVPTIPAYLADIKAASPIYETRPNLITITQTSTSPLKLQLLFEEPADYLNLETRRPSEEWWNRYQRSYYRLGTNRSTGFSGSDAQVRKAPAKQPTKSQVQN